MIGGNELRAALNDAASSIRGLDPEQLDDAEAAFAATGLEQGPAMAFCELLTRDILRGVIDGGQESVHDLISSGLMEALVVGIRAGRADATKIAHEMAGHD